jgi:molybdopterin-guanine dinucleotide biosynthesis protein A
VISVSSHRRLEDCTGVLLAGGRGTRLGGVAKGLLTLEGQTLAARSVALFRSVFAAVTVIADDPAPYASLGVQTERDRLSGKGAPGGLHAALATSRTRWVFVAGCDMPFLAEPPIRFLAARRIERAPAVVPVWKGLPQPLHALWSTAALPMIERMLASSDASLQAIVLAVGADLVPEATWREIDPGGRALENANGPGDLVRLGLARPPG